MASGCGCEAIQERIGICSQKNEVEGINNEKEGCYKCGRPIVVLGRERSCRECFLEVFSKNFRSNLRTKCLEPKESARKVGITYSEGLAPSSLLHLVLKRNQDRHMKIRGRDSDGNPEERDHTFQKITESDDLKIRLIIKIVKPGEKEDLESTWKEFSKGVLSTFEKFTKNYKIRDIAESESLIETEIGEVRVALAKSCYFLHSRRNLREREKGSLLSRNEDISTNMDLDCTKECQELELNLRKLIKQDEDCGRHIWRSVRMTNLKEYIANNGGICTHMLSPETQEEVCKEAFFLTCIGLGSEVSSRTSFVDKASLKGCSILRPLKTFSLKEVAYYQQFNELGELQAKPEKFGKNSIMGSIEWFSEELSSHHSNSFHNMTNITNRLVESPLELLNGGLKGCRICQAGSNRRSEVNLVDPESEEVCKGCDYFRIKNSEILEYLEEVFESYSHLNQK